MPTKEPATSHLTQQPLSETDKAITKEPATSHLTQQPLSKTDKAILEDLESWLSQAKFEKKEENVELCVNERLDEKWVVLRNMDFIKKVWGIIVKL